MSAADVGKNHEAETEGLAGILDPLMLEVGAISDSDLLAEIVGSKTEALRILESAGSLLKLALWNEQELGPGVNARAVKAAFEIGRRVNAMRLKRGAPMVSSLEVYRHFRSRIQYNRVEIFMAGLVDVKNCLVREVTISQGALSSALVHPREAYGAAVREPAHGIVFVHNHPSGDPTPSDEDVALTRRLVAAGDILGIRLLDHVVIGDSDYYSFADSGKLRV
jgi:DNA repair protein RadC